MAKPHAEGLQHGFLPRPTRCIRCCASRAAYITVGAFSAGEDTRKERFTSDRFFHPSDLYDVRAEPQDHRSTSCSKIPAP